MTLIQSLPASIDLNVDQMRLLDTLGVKRNVIDYSGEVVDRESLASCIEAADCNAKRTDKVTAMTEILDEISELLGGTQPTGSFATRRTAEQFGVTVGGNDQAWLYREEMRDVWETSPGALEWLRKTSKSSARR